MHTSVEEKIRIWKQSPEVRAFVQKYSEASTLRQILSFTTDWLIIFLSAGLSRRFPGVLCYSLAVITIASRQHALGILMHDGAHFRLAKNRFWNDLLSDFFLGFPLLAATGWYRAHHAEHHRHLNSEKDPDWARKIHLPEWQFPQAGRKITRTLAKQIFVGGIEWLYLMGMMATRAGTSKHRLLRAIYYLSLAAVVTWAQAWNVVLLYWFVPLLTLFPLIQRFRSMTEHFALKRESELSEARDTRAGALERFLLSPHGTNYHLVHHLFPSVPHYHLGKLHREFMRSETYASLAHVNSSYLFGPRSVLSDLRQVSKPASTAEKSFQQSA